MLLATLAVLVVTQPARPEAREHRARVSSRAGGRLGAVPPTYFEFAPSSGAGLPVAEDLCSALAAEVPNWATPVDGGAGNWCLGGDGQEVAGSEADFSPSGSPVASSPSYCPSGLDCAAKTATWLGTISDAHASAAKTSTSAAPMSVCWLGMHTTDSVWDNFMFGPGWAFTLKSDTAYRLTIAGTETSTGGLSLLAVNLVCGTYSGTAKGYFNGALGSTSGALTRAAATTANTLRGYPSASLTFGAFYVDQELSAAQIAAIARRVLADQPKALIRGSPSVALTYTRTGTSYCSKADNTGTLLPANRPCIAQGGLLVEAEATNVAVRSQEIDHASWLKNGSPVTANYALAPDGTKTAERFVVTAGGNQFAYSSVTGTAGANTVSVYVKSVSGALTFPVCAYIGTGYTCTSCSISTSAWTRCTHTVTATTDWRWLMGDYYVDNAAREVLVWSFQSETGSVATSYIPTTSAAATRGAAIAYLTHGQATYSTGCIAGTRASSVAMNQYANNGFVSTEDGTGGSYQQTILSFLGLKGYVGQASQATGTLPSVAGTDRLILRWDGSGTTLDTNGTLTTGAAGTPAATTILRIGNYGGGATEVWPGRYSAVQLDPRPSRCR